MNSPLTTIPVGPVPFDHGLKNFAQALTRGHAKIVAIGSSTTAGEGNIKAYPDRLICLLRAEYSTAAITMVNKGVGGQEAPAELHRFAADVIDQQPDLVIWQVGTNAVWQTPDQHPPSFDQTVAAIRQGLVKLRDETQADIILMDLQYVPALLTAATTDRAVAMVVAIEELARDAEVNVFKRFAFMKALVEIERVSFDRIVDPNDDARLHDSDWTTQRLTVALTQVIKAGVDKARSTSPPA